MHAWNLGQTFLDQPAYFVDINNSTHLGVLGFQEQSLVQGSWLETHAEILPFFRIFRSRGRVTSTILSLSFLNCQAQWRICLLPPSNPFFTLPSAVTNTFCHWLRHPRHYCKCWNRGLFCLSVKWTWDVEWHLKTHHPFWPGPPV